MRRTAFLSIAALLAGVCIGAPSSPPTRADFDVQPETLVYLNGVATPVFFNDGDSFRALSGPYERQQTRIAGYNTLESFGPVHQWGTFAPFELYVVAKEATLNARRGVWHCTSNLQTDGYGRTLWMCPDLAISDLRAGLAHAYSADEEPAQWAYLRAQREAQAAHRGMWAHGIPEFIMTSVHSADEDAARGQHYNRLISTVDGHTESWEHHDSYHECQQVCAEDVVVDAARVDAVSARLRESASLRTVLDGVDNLHLTEAVSMYARDGRLPTWATEAQRTQLGAALAVAHDAGELGQLTRRPGSCMTYVTFNRRYGPGRAPCLQH